MDGEGEEGETLSSLLNQISPVFAGMFSLKSWKESFVNITNLLNKFCRECFSW